MEISETRTYKIKGKIFRSKNIRSLFKNVQKIIDKNDDKSIGIYQKYSVRASDGSRYTSESNGIFKKGGIIDQKQIDAINFNYQDSKSGISIEINISHSNSDWNNEFQVVGKDSTWVNGVVKQISEIIDSCESQKQWPNKYSIFIKALFSISLGVFSGYVVLWLIVLLKTEESSNVASETSWSLQTFLSVFLFFGFFTMLSIIPSDIFYKKVKNLYKDVELQLGKDYQQLEKSKRRKINTIFTLVILPAIFMILQDIIF
nr:hypothetical protein [uncultured Psychroserpens sp.]